MRIQDITEVEMSQFPVCGSFILNGLTNERKLCSIADDKIYFFCGQSKLGVEVTESIA
jgi:hypothetical protein